MRWSAQRIKDGYLHEWVTANCYAYVKLFVRNLPLQSKLKPNSPPVKGAVAIFEYKGTPHFAYVTELQEDGFMIKEANYEPAKITKRLVKWNDKNLKGFWKATTSP